MELSFILINEKVKSILKHVEGFVEPLHNYTQTPPGLLQKDTTESIMQYEPHALAFLISFLQLCVLIKAEQLTAEHGGYLKKTKSLHHSPSPVPFTCVAFTGATVCVMNKLARGF